MQRSPSPRLLTALGLLLATVATLALARLAGEFEDRGATLEQLLPRAEAEHLARGGAPFAREGELVLVALTGSRAPWDDERVANLAHALAEVPGVVRAEELPLQGRSRDPNLRLLGLATASGELLLAEARQLDSALEAVLASARHADECAYAVGRPRLRAESWRLASSDLARLLPVLALLALGIPWVFLGSPGAGLFALLVAACTSALALWGYRLLGGPLNPLALVVLPLLWAIATMDALHLAGRVRALAARGLAPEQCVRRARRELSAPCWLTTLTTAAGLAGMAAFGHAELFRELGWVSAAGTLAAHPLTFGACAPFAALAAGRGRPPPWPMALGLAAIRAARRAPGRWILGWSVLAAGALLGLPRLTVANPFPRLFAPGTALARDLEHLAGALDTDLNPLEIRVRATDEDGRRAPALASAVLALGHALQALPETRLVLPLDALTPAALDVRREVGLDPVTREAALARLLERAELAPWVALDEGAARLQLHLAPTSFAEKRVLLARLAHFDRTMLAHHALELAGTGAVTQRVEELGLRDLASGTLLSALAIAAVLAVGLRRPRTWATALIASTLPLLLVAGFLGWTSIPWSIALLPLPGVLLGIALDDSIHLLWRPRGRERFGALPACLATTLLVTASVACLAWSSFAANRSFGGLLALGLVLALAADLTLLPALMRMSLRGSPRSWWLRGSRRTAPRPAP